MKDKKLKKGILYITSNLLSWGITITCIFPIVWLLYSSLKTKEEFLLDTLSLPTELQIGNYIQAFKIGNLWLAMGNSAFYTGLNIVLVCISALVVGYFMARFTFKGKKVIYFTYMLGMLIPLYALLVPVFVQYKVLGVLNTRIPIIITYYAMCMPIAIFLCESFIQGIPYELDEASVVDGCTLSQRLALIIFPLTKPILATVAILTMLSSWNEYGFAAVLTSDSSLRTVSVAMKSFSSGSEVEYTFLMAGLFAASLPLLIIYTLFSKQVVKGMVAGAVKG
ncbi:MAG: carbohydrate ABC transporter permease [Eubacteriales bacterium]